MPLARTDSSRSSGTATIFRLPSSPLTKRPQSEILASLPPSSSFPAVLDFKSRMATAFLESPDLSLQPPPNQDHHDRGSIFRIRLRNVLRKASPPSSPTRTHSRTASSPPSLGQGLLDDVSPLELPALGLGMGLGLEDLDMGMRRPVSMDVGPPSSFSPSKPPSSWKRRFSFRAQ